VSVQTVQRSESPETLPVDRNFLTDVLTGLSGLPKTLPCKYFYDQRGSRLFEQICDLDEYYVTRTELSIMEESVHEMARVIGPGSNVLEFGSGAGIKIRLLLDALDNPRSYTPMDISQEILFQSSAELRESFPGLIVSPVLADYTEAFPALETFRDGEAASKLVYFPGSTLGNFDAQEARTFLSRIAELLAPGGGLLIGLDLVKSEAVLNLAYDDPGGVTAEFNRNLLHRMNDELGADFIPDQFSHRARYDRELNRVEMHLVSECDQVVSMDGTAINFRRGEGIHTENSHKYSPTGFESLAGSCGFEVRGYWTDELEYFGVFYLAEVRGDSGGF
jgi:dimethylhistidine N-methyltransferase